MLLLCVSIFEIAFITKKEVSARVLKHNAVEYPLLLA
jgi:hypothetical protein